MIDIQNLSPDAIERALEGQSQTVLEQVYQAALDRLPSKAPIFTPTEKIPLVDKIKGVEHVRRIYRHDLDALYRPQLRELKERFKGRKRCFLIGNGPSLNETDLRCLKDEVTFAVNGFFLKAAELDWLPTFYCVEDHLVAEDRAAWINDFKGPIKFFPAYLGYMFPPGEDTIFYNHRPRKSYPHGFDFSLEADKITYTGCTVTFSLMQLAAYLGFEEIYLIGVDASYEIPDDVEEGDDYDVGVLDMKSDDPNHFNKDYFGKGFRWHDPQVHLMVEAYKEAHRTLEPMPQTIYNAGIGGKLEVFERRAFADIFPHARAPQEVLAENDAHAAAKEAARVPRLLVIDMTAMGNGTATGEIKSTLLAVWGAGDILQVSAPRSDTMAVVRPYGPGSFREEPMDEAAIREAINDFDPEAILYRPLADRPALHRFAMAEIEARQLPLVTWIMDDWPERLRAKDAALHAALDTDLRNLFDRSVTRLSISEAMSRAFETRYGAQFVSIANGIHPHDWPGARRHEGARLVLRYAGGLAPDMNAAAIQRVARAVEARAAAGQDITFEINTQPHWLKTSGHLFDGFTATRLTAVQRTTVDDRAWLAKADALLIAYNDDEPSLRYVRYSMANKLPECLSSGAALLVCGPRGVATVDTVLERGLGQVVTSTDQGDLEAALAELSSAERRSALSSAAWSAVHVHYDLRKISADLEDIVRAATNKPRLEAREALAQIADLKRAAARQAAVENQLEQAHEEVANRDQRLEHMRATLDDMVRLNEDRDREIAELKGALDAERGRAEEKEAHVSALLATRSWRITAPLRYWSLKLRR